MIQWAVAKAHHSRVGQCFKPRVTIAWTVQIGRIVRPIIATKQNIPGLVRVVFARSVQ